MRTASGILPPFARSSRKALVNAHDLGRCSTRTNVANTTAGKAGKIPANDSMRYRTLLFAAIIPVLIASHSVRAAVWPPDGQAIAEHGSGVDVPACVSCHGSNFGGKSGSGAPSLRAKSAPDLMDDLYTEAANTKNHSKMAGIARHLSMAQRAAVTAYIAHITHSGD